MGLRFIIGRSGTGKSGRTLDEIKEKLLEDPLGKPIFYIVPEQMTFQQEYALFLDEEVQGSMRAQVVSFSRLAWRVLQETGGGTKQFISSVGIQMMLRKIIEDRKGDWLTFQKALEKQGFLQQMEDIIIEFKRYQITPEVLRLQIDHLKQFVHKEEKEEALAGKLEDILYIYQSLVTALKDNYIDSEDRLQLLANKISKADLLEDAEIYLDGFHRFTPMELQVVEELLKKCKTVTITLTLEDPEEELNELDLFYQTTETYHILEQTALENRIPVDEVIQMDTENGKFRNRPYFLHLEKYFDQRPAPSYDGKAAVQIAEAVHPRAEVEGAAQEILRLVREENYRYKDIAVLIRETGVYHDIIQTIFNDYDIPVFVDEKRPMMNHSLIEFIRSILDIVEGDWRYDAIFRVLKTGYIPITDPDYPLNDEAIDELENYVIEYGIRSRKRWFGEERWKYQRFRGFGQTAQTNHEKEIETRINRYRYQVVQALTDFDELIRKAKTVREYCEITYLLLENLGVREKLEEVRQYYDEAGQLEKGREQEQAWNAVLQLMDEIVEMVGEEEMSLNTFRNILEAGFETLQFSHVPPSIDHVIVGTIDRSRMSGIQCSFLLGVNEGVWPMKPPSDGIINEDERELLSNEGIKLADSSKRQLLDDWFYMYLAFTQAKDRLWISYPLSDNEGKAKMPSQVIKRIEDLFPNCKNHILLQDPDELVDAERFITTPMKTRSALTAQLSRHEKGYPIQPIWWHVLNWYIEHRSKNSITYRTLQSLYYQNRPENLKKETVEAMFPKEIKASVSRLESYYRCAYQHFAKYSLQLDERKTYKLDAPDIGMLFHEAIKVITEWVQKDDRDFTQLSKADAKNYADMAVSRLSPIFEHQILHSSNRYQYIRMKLQEIVARATYILSEQARRSHFAPVGLELGFGIDETLPPLTMELPNGYTLLLRGRIDRVDKATNVDKLYLRIIDYKSSSRGLDLIEVYYGLALQMLAYLDVVITNSEQWLKQKATPAGVLYFHVHNPMISKDTKPDMDSIEKEIFKKYKMDGLLLSDREVVQMMDESLEKHSDMIPAGFKKDGSFLAYSKVTNKETFEHLQNHIHLLMKDAGLDITSGGVHLNPYQYKDKKACTYCPFLSVCQFDPILEENNYHKLKEMKEKEIVEKINKEVEVDG